jgi:hypothetical protein
MDAITIRCKDCSALFYANAHIQPDDILDIIRYAQEGHTVAVVDAEVVRVELATCYCLEKERDRP